jgi:CPA1 family monovalent cation:H+ antiporter
VLLLLIALVVILFTKKLSIPYTLGLVVAGLLLGFFHLIPEAQLTPDLVLFVFLPPLLFEGGWSLNFPCSKRIGAPSSFWLVKVTRCVAETEIVP